MIPHVNGSKNDFEEDELSHAIEQARKVKWYDWILLNRPLRVIVTLLIVTILSPILVYLYIFFPSLDLPPPDGFSSGSCLVPRDNRLPCGIEAVTSAQCHAQCCYDLTNNMCFHRYPARFSYLFHGNWSEDLFLNPRIPIVPYALQRSITNIRLSIDEVSATHLSLTFYKSEQALTGRRLEEKNYEYIISEPELNVIVNSTQGNIFNTARGPLIASENIWEVSFKLTNESMFGLGEIPLKGDMVKVIYSHKRGMNSVPLIFAKSNGSYHGVLIDTMTPTEIIVRNDNQLVVRSITNWGLKLHVFVGPKPSDVMKDVMAAIGVKKGLEYWMLGAHVCSENTTFDSLTELRTFINTATTQRMPFDSHCSTGPIVFDTECNSTKINLLNQGATLIRNGGKKFVPHVSPYIRYTEPVSPEEDKENETRSNERCYDDKLYNHYNIYDSQAAELYKGVVDDHEVIYPSYENVNEEFMQNLWLYDTNFDSVILENNWPLDESEKNVEEINNYLPYFSEHFAAAFNYTPQWNATRPVFIQTLLSNDTQLPRERYLNNHNDYGNHFTTAFEKIKGPVPTASTSQWMNGNVIINRQSVQSSWTGLQKELIEASLGGISGHWYWSTPVCGDTEHFNNATQIRLCAKWYMAATYMPMIKIHSKEIPRDPLSFVGTDRTHMITALTRRMSLLPYFYSVLQEGPLLRPMFYQFPSSEDLKDLTTQFAVGDNLLIVPNLLPNQTHVHVKMPPGPWYELWSGLKINAEEGEVTTMSTTEADFLTLINGGSVVVMQKVVQLTADSTRLQSAYSLVIALNCETSNIRENFITTEGNEFTSTTQEISQHTDGDEPSSTTEIQQHTDADEPSSTTEIQQHTDADEPSSTTEITEETYANEEINTTTDANEQTVTTCDATGKLFMTENITIIFEANSNKLKITNSGDDFQVLCDPNKAIWSSHIKEVIVYGLNTDQNNYDNHRVVTAAIDLCQLQTNEEIIFQFVE